MTLVLEYNQARIQTTQTCSGEGLQALGVGDTEVVLAREDQNGRIPTVDKLMGRIGVRAHCRSVRLVPIRTAIVVIDEPQFLGLAIHRLEVVDTAVSDECLETLLVVTSEEEGRVAAIRSTDATHTIAIAPRLACHVVDRREVVADILTAIIARDLIQPLLTERGQTTTVRSNHNVTLSRHQLEVPAVAPKLAYDALRTALAVEQRRIFLCGVEVGRQDHPNEHLLVVGGLDPALLDTTHRNVVVDGLIDVRQLSDSTLSVNRIELSSRRDGRDLGNHLLAHLRKGVDVVIALGQHLDLARSNSHAANLMRSLDRCDEVDRLLALPNYVCGVVVEALGYIDKRLLGAVIDQQTILVALVARTAHRADSNLAIVGRPNGILVVATHRRHNAQTGILHGLLTYEVTFADVACLATLQVINIDVRVGRNGILGARHRLAGICQRGTGVVPRDLGCVEVGCQRGIPSSLRADDVDRIRDACRSVEVGNEDVAVVALVPIAPMASHQIVVDTSLRLVHILIDVLRENVLNVHRLNVIDLLARGSDAESLDVALDVRHLTQHCVGGGYVPNLHRATAIREEEDRAAVGCPLRADVVAGVVGQLARLATLDGLNIDRGYASILGHIIIGNRIGDLRAVGRERRRTYTSHLPHHLG